LVILFGSPQQQFQGPGEKLDRLIGWLRWPGRETQPVDWLPTIDALWQPFPTSGDNTIATSARTPRTSARTRRTSQEHKEPHKNTNNSRRTQTTVELDI
jgi:hypothetical protein